MIKQYRKKPVVIEAVQWTGNNPSEIVDFVGEGKRLFTYVHQVWGTEMALQIKTLEGTMSADIGDYIIKGVKGEFYPCKPDVFQATYKEV